MWFSNLTNQPFKNHPFYSHEKFPLNQLKWKKKKKNSLVLSVVTSNLTSDYDKIRFFFKNGREIKTK